MYGSFGLSVEGVVDATLQETCRGPRVANYGHIRLSTVGRLRGRGFAVVPTFELPHFTVALPDVSELTLARLDRCFDAPIPNPASAPHE